MATFEKYKDFDDIRRITIVENRTYRFVICTFTKQSSRNQTIKYETLIDGKHVNLKITTPTGKNKPWEEKSTKLEIKNIENFVNVCHDWDDDQSLTKMESKRFSRCCYQFTVFTTSSNFEKFLSRYGKVRFVKIILSKNTGSKAYCYFTINRNKMQLNN